MADPTSYSDPYWTQLASSTEDKLGLPTGLLQSIITHGERSNADQVSEAGARTVAQIIPSTRKAAIEKYGVDPYLSGQNAVEVAGRLLKDSLDRHDGDVGAAVGEYHGGTDPANWGPKTKAYVARVTRGHDAIQTDALGKEVAAFKAANPLAPGMIEPGNIDLAHRPQVKNPDGSTSTVRSLGVNIDGQEVLIPTVSDDGRILSNQDAIAQYKATGRHLGKFESPGASTAYAQQLHTQQAHQYGLDADPLVRDIGAWKVSQQTPGQAPFIPQTADGGSGIATPHPDAPMGPVDAVVGAGEAALTAGTGLLGMPVAALSRLTLHSPEEAEAAGNAVVYQPRTDAGKQQAAALGEFANQNLLPLAGMAPELAALHAGATPALQMAAPAAAAALDRVATGVPQAARNLAAKVGLGGGEETPAAATPGTLASAGAAGTDLAAQRAATAEALPVPVELTKGQATRDFAQQRFERETAKDPNVGAPLRERFAQQNEDILRNFDTMVDMTGAEAPTLRATGEAVDSALKAQMQADKNAVRAAYKKAETAGELEQPVTLDSVVQHMNDNAPAATTAPVLDAARKFAVKLGVASEDDSGNLVAQPVTLATAEQFRKAINRSTNFEPTNVYQSAQMKGLIDQATDGLGGNLYQQARALRARLAQNYENHATVSKLLDMKKGTADRAVALEDVFQHTILNSSKDDVANLRRVLQRAGPNGWQAWRELQGATMRHISDEATKNVATDVRGNPIVSASRLQQVVRGLDHDGKLEFIFGKKGSQQVRDLVDLARVVYTSPPGAVNTSNTASVLIAALSEAGLTGSMTGLPVPVLSGLRLIAQQVKNRRIQQRVTEALGQKASKKTAPTRHVH
jgi:hypothetical protein